MISSKTDMLIVPNVLHMVPTKQILQLLTLQQLEKVTQCPPELPELYKLALITLFERHTTQEEFQHQLLFLKKHPYYTSFQDVLSERRFRFAVASSLQSCFSSSMHKHYLLNAFSKRSDSAQLFNKFRDKAVAECSNEAALQDYYLKRFDYNHEEIAKSILQHDPALIPKLSDALLPAFVRPLIEQLNDPFPHKRMAALSAVITLIPKLSGSLSLPFLDPLISMLKGDMLVEVRAVFSALGALIPNLSEDAARSLIKPIENMSSEVVIDLPSQERDPLPSYLERVSSVCTALFQKFSEASAKDYLINLMVTKSDKYVFHGPDTPSEKELLRSAVRKLSDPSVLELCQRIEFELNHTVNGSYRGQGIVFAFIPRVSINYALAWIQPFLCQPSDANWCAVKNIINGFLNKLPADEAKECIWKLMPHINIDVVSNAIALFIPRLSEAFEQECVDKLLVLSEDALLQVLKAVIPVLSEKSAEQFIPIILARLNTGDENKRDLLFSVSTVLLSKISDKYAPQFIDPFIVELSHHIVNDNSCDAHGCLVLQAIRAVLPKLPANITPCFIDPILTKLSLVELNQYDDDDDDDDDGHDDEHNLLLKTIADLIPTLSDKQAQSFIEPLLRQFTPLQRDIWINSAFDALSRLLPKLSDESLYPFSELPLLSYINFYDEYDEAYGVALSVMADLWLRLPNKPIHVFIKPFFAKLDDNRVDANDKHSPLGRVLKAMIKLSPFFTDVALMKRYLESLFTLINYSRADVPLIAMKALKSIDHNALSTQVPVLMSHTMQGSFTAREAALDVLSDLIVANHLQLNDIEALEALPYSDPEARILSEIWHTWTDIKPLPVSISVNHSGNNRMGLFQNPGVRAKAVPLITNASFSDNPCQVIFTP